MCIQTLLMCRFVADLWAISLPCHMSFPGVIPFIVSPSCLSHSLACDLYVQDWFSGHLKHLVMELGRSGAGVVATDGAKMSTMSSQYYEESVTEQTEGVPLDLTE